MNYECYKKFIITYLRALLSQLESIKCVDQTATADCYILDSGITQALDELERERHDTARLTLERVSLAAKSLNSKGQNDSLARTACVNFVKVYNSIKQNGIDRLKQLYHKALLSGGPRSEDDFQNYSLAGLRKALQRDGASTALNDLIRAVWSYCHGAADPVICFAETPFLSAEFACHTYCIYCELKMMHCKNSYTHPDNCCQFDICYNKLTQQEMEEFVQKGIYTKYQIQILKNWRESQYIYYSSPRDVPHADPDIEFALFRHIKKTRKPPLPPLDEVE